MIDFLKLEKKLADIEAKTTELDVIDVSLTAGLEDEDQLVARAIKRSHAAV